MGRRDAIIPVVAATAAPSWAATPPVVTDCIYLDLSGLESSSSQRIVIGLYERDAPQPVSFLRGLVSDTGLLGVPCRERPVRTLQREQLEANKVYDACLEQTTPGKKEVGVTYEMSTVWRIERDRRIDVGSVSGNVSL